MKDIILKHALLNAQDFGGKANPGSVIGKVIAEKPEFKSDMKILGKTVAQVVKEVNSWSAAKQKEELKKFGEIKKIEKVQREGLPPLPNAVMGKVVMRLAPFPSGPLHIGNAKPYILNDEYVKMYNGKLLLVIDDTIGSEQKQIAPEAYDLIPEGLKWLGFNFDPKIVYKSDRLEIFYKYAKEMIEKNAAYFCKCDAETMRSNREKGVECFHRKQSIDENMKGFEKMLAGKYKEGEAVLRLKTNMQDPNPAFRDRILLRISNREHPRTGTKYKVWPMLDFCWAIDDHLLGITHILRGNDLVIESQTERFIWDIFGWKHPEIIHTGLVGVSGVKLSKSKAQEEVRKGIYTGWSDPRTWSLQSLRKRGILPEAIRSFAISSGVTDHNATVPVDKIYTENRKLIDKEAKRYFFVSEPTEITLDTVPEKEAKAPVYPGKKVFRKIPTSKNIFVDRLDFVANKGKEVRLMHFCNIQLDHSSKVTDKALKDVPKLHWVGDKNVRIKLIMPDGTEVNGLAEPDIKKAKADDMVQFERVGFARCDGKGVFYFAHK